MAHRQIIFDSLIIGSGPAGLSTALGLGRAGRTCAVLSNSKVIKYRNDGIEASHAVLGHDHVHPQEIYAKGRQQIKRYQNTTFVDDAEIINIEKKENMTELGGKKTGFIASDREGRKWTGKTLVMATGVKDMFPDLEGYKENWPQNIYQCLFCDGFERRTMPRGFLCYPNFQPMAAKMASMLLHLDPDNTSPVTVFANGKPDENDQAVAAALKQCKANGMKIDTRPVIRLVNAGPQKEGLYVHLRNEDGSEDAVFQGFLNHKPPTTPNSKHLIEQLGLTVTPSMFGEIVKTDAPFQTTNIPGVYSIGDAGAAMTHVTTAMLSGVAAAAGITHVLNEWDDERALETYSNTADDARKIAQKLPNGEIDPTGCTD